MLARCFRFRDENHALTTTSQLLNCNNCRSIDYSEICICEIWFRAISSYSLLMLAYVVTMRKIDHNILPLAGPD